MTSCLGVPWGSQTISWILKSLSASRDQSGSLMSCGLQPLSHFTTSPLICPIDEMKGEAAFTFTNLKDNRKIIRQVVYFFKCLKLCLLEKPNKFKRWSYFYNSASSGIGSVSQNEPIGHYVLILPGLDIKTTYCLHVLETSIHLTCKTAMIITTASWGMEGAMKIEFSLIR